MAPPGNQAANGENKHQPIVSGEIGLLDSSHRGDGNVDVMKCARENMKLGLPGGHPIHQGMGGGLER